jgi:hypothetical protein
MADQAVVEMVVLLELLEPLILEAVAVAVR